MSETDTAPIQDVQMYQLERSLEFARKEDDPTKLINALADYGHALLKDGDAPKGLTQFEESIKLAEEIGDEEQQARLWGYKGMALKAIGNFAQSRAAFNKSNRFARNTNHQVLICDSLLQIGLLQIESDEIPKGISKLEQAYAVAVQEKDVPRKMHIATILGNTFAGIDSGDKALEYYADALEQALELRNGRAECSIRMGIANVQIRLDEFQAALEQFDTALDVASRLEEPNAEISALNGLMEANAHLDKLRLATTYGEQAISLARQIQNAEAELFVLRGLVGILLNHQDYEKTLALFQRGLELANEKQDGEVKLNMLTGLAFAHYSLEDTDRAEQVYQELFEEAQRLQNPVAESTALGRLSAICADKEDFDTALEFAEKALNKANETENIALVAEQKLLVALTYCDLDKNDEAKAYFEDSIKAYESLGNEAMASQVASLRDEALA